MSHILNCIVLPAHEDGSRLESLNRLVKDIYPEMASARFVDVGYSLEPKVATMPIWLMAANAVMIEDVIAVIDRLPWSEPPIVLACPEYEYVWRSCPVAADVRGVQGMGER